MMMRKSHVFPVFIFLMGISLLLQASTIEIGNQRYTITAWGIEDGLPQNSVLCLTQTRDGYIWFGTQLGLVRFDGMSVRVYNRWNTKELKSDRILCLYEDPGGILWVGNEGGLSGLNLKGEWTLYSTRQGLSNNTVRAIAGDGENHLWLGTDHGIIRLDTGTGTIKTFTVEDGLSGYPVTALALSHKDGALWIGTAGSGLDRLEKGKFLPVPSKEVLIDKEITVLHEDRSGILRIGTDDGLYRLVGSEIHAIENAGSLSGSSIKAILEDSSGNLWIGTDGEGLWNLDKSFLGVQPRGAGSPLELPSSAASYVNNLPINSLDSKPFNLLRAKSQELRANSKSPLVAEGIKTVSTQQGFPDDFIYSLLEDREGNLWLGTFTTGLVRLKPAKVQMITTANGLLEDRVHTVLRDDAGDLWVGQHSGLVQLKLENHIYRVRKTFTEAGGMPGDGVNALFLDREINLWVGTQGGGLVKMEKAQREQGKFQVYTTANGLSSDDITAIYQDRVGALWVGTGSGLNRWEEGKFSSPLLKPGIGHIPVRTLGETREGNLLVGTPQGLYLLKGNDLQPLGLEYEILSVYEDRSGDLWIGTNGSGLVRCKQGNPAQCTIFTTNNGLPGNAIFSLEEDRAGHLWMTSYQGVFRVSKKELTDIADGKNPTAEFITVISFDEKDGLLNRECTGSGNPSAWLSPGSGNGDGETLFIPTVKGIAVIPLEPAGVPRPGLKPQPPPVIIENVIADNRSVINLASAPILPPGTQVVEFYFTALNFSAPEKVRIWYKLEGFDPRWQEAKPQQKRQAFYLNLPAGDYKFKVMACSNEGVWNRQGTRFEFKINSYFYQRPLFYAALLLTLALAAGAIYQLGFRHKKTNADKTPQEQEPKKEKYKTSALLPETVDQVIPRLSRLMEQEKVFLDPDLNLKKLSEKLHVHYNHLSQIINERLGKSFNDYLNGYRIEEAMKMLADPAQDHKTILEIAYDTGFYSKSVFNTAFKKFTGLTPSQYKKKFLSSTTREPF